MATWVKAGSSDLEAAAAGFMAEAEALDAQTARSLTYAWADVYGRIRLDLDAVAAKIAEAQATGQPISPAWLYQQARLRTLLKTTKRELALYGKHTGTALKGAQASAVAAATKAAEKGALAAVEAAGGPPGFDLGWHTVDPENLKHLLANLSPGSPLRDLFDGMGTEGAKRLEQRLVQGLALGWNARKIAQHCADGLDLSRQRALLIARTETLRSYRDATRAAYTANSHVVQGWVWSAALDRRCCAACVLMHGTHHLATERLDGHPRCRCAMIPDLVPWDQLLGPDHGIPDQPPMETGHQWLLRQPAAVQRAVLGGPKYGAWRAGKITLDDVVGQSYNPRWGTMRYERSLKRIEAGVDPNPGPHPSGAANVPVEPFQGPRGSLLAGPSDVPLGPEPLPAAQDAAVAQNVLSWAAGTEDMQAEQIALWAKWLETGEIGPGVSLGPQALANVQAALDRVLAIQANAEAKVAGWMGQYAKYLEAGPESLASFTDALKIISEGQATTDVQVAAKIAARRVLQAVEQGKAEAVAKRAQAYADEYASAKAGLAKQFGHADQVKYLDQQIASAQALDAGPIRDGYLKALNDLKAQTIAEHAAKIEAQITKTLDSALAKGDLEDFQKTLTFVQQATPPDAKHFVGAWIEANGDAVNALAAGPSQEIGAQFDAVVKGWLETLGSGKTTMTELDASIEAVKASPSAPQWLFDALEEAKAQAQAKGLGVTTAEPHWIVKALDDVVQSSGLDEAKAEAGYWVENGSPEAKIAAKKWLDKQSKGEDALAKFGLGPKAESTGAVQQAQQAQAVMDHGFPFDVKTLTRDASHSLGGAHEKIVYTAPDGSRWMLKPQEPWGAEIDKATAWIQKQAGLPTPETYVVTVEGRTGSIQRLYESRNAFGSKSGFDVAKLAAHDTVELQKHNVLDWLIGNHDGHAEQYLRRIGKDSPTGSGMSSVDNAIVGIDKGQAYKHFGTDALDYNYHPNAKFGEAEPVANLLNRAKAEGHPPAGWQNVNTEGELREFVKRLQGLDDDAYRAALRGYAEAAQAKGTLAYGDVEKFLDAAVARKNALLKDFEAFHAKIDPAGTPEAPGAKWARLLAEKQPPKAVKYDLGMGSAPPGSAKEVRDAWKLANTRGNTDALNWLNDHGYLDRLDTGDERTLDVLLTRRAEQLEASKPVEPVQPLDAIEAALEKAGLTSTLPGVGESWTAKGLRADIARMLEDPASVKRWNAVKRTILYARGMDGTRLPLAEREALTEALKAIRADYAKGRKQYAAALAKWLDANGSAGSSGFHPATYRLKGMDGALRHDDYNGPQWADQFWQGFSDRLTAEEKAAIRTYTGGDYTPINTYLRSGRTGNAQWDAIARAITSAGEKWAAWQQDASVVVVRGSDSRALRAMMEKFAPHLSPDEFGSLEGHVLVDEGLMSASVGNTPGFASGGDVWLNLRVSPGTPMTWVSQRSGALSVQGSGEREVIFARGTHFYVHKVRREGHRWVLDVEVVPPDWRPS